jgi:hypothetical protein
LAFTCFDATTKLEVMILFSCCGQSEIKKSFMSLREIGLPFVVSLAMSGLSGETVC